MINKEQILTATIIRCKQELIEYRGRVKNYERSLHEAEAALKRLNEEKRKTTPSGTKRSFTRGFNIGIEDHDNKRED